MCSKSVHSISKILKDFPFWRDTFEHRFLKNYFMTTKKCNKIIISCLWTDWKNKSFCNVSLFANIFRDIPQILLNRRHLKCFKKSAHIFLNMKKFNIMMKRKQLIMIYWQISIEKYVPKHPISLIKIFFVTFLRYWMIKKTILKMISPEWTMKEDVKNWLYTLMNKYSP